MSFDPVANPVCKRCEYIKNAGPVRSAWPPDLTINDMSQRKNICAACWNWLVHLMKTLHGAA